MQCRHCLAATRVLSTRVKSPSLVVRRLECLADPEHRFNTYEVPESAVRYAGKRFDDAVAMADAHAETRADRNIQRKLTCSK